MARWRRRQRVAPPAGTLGRAFRAALLATVVLSLRLARADEPTGADEPAATAAPGSFEKAPSFEKDVAPLLAKYCNSCHSGEKKKGGLALDVFTDEPSALKDRNVWRRVSEMLHARKMPPRTRRQPTAPEMETLIKWSDGAVGGFDCNGPPEPGRVTIRRLNRVEYNNTIRDLVGVDFRPGDDFPSDDVGYGFDNIGDVLSLPPILMEKYLAAASEIAGRAIVADHRFPKPLNTKVEAESMRSEGGAGKDGGWVRLKSGQGVIRTRVDTPGPGEYLFRVRAFAAPGGPARLSLKADDKEPMVLEVKATEAAPETYEARIVLEEGQRRCALSFLKDEKAGDSAENKEASKEASKERTLSIDYLSVEGPVDRKLPGPPDSHRRILICEPSGGNTADCARRVIENLLRRAYRRPPKPEEVERLMGLAKAALADAEGFERAMQVVLMAVLVSPHFLFRVEVDPAGTAGQVHPLSEFELATRLSYFVWNSMPDEELYSLAEAGLLRENVDGQVRRMLRDPRSRALVENFAGQWLQLRNLRTSTPDRARFPAFDDELREAMLQETQLFFEEVLREDRSILDFLDGGFTYLNERLARHYGIDGVKGPEFRRVPLEGGLRGGVLTHASVLTVTSNPTRTSPVKRGKWVLENFLGSPPPPPPPGAGDLSEDAEVVLTGSLRQRMEQHRSRPDCFSCHSRMDPLGFGLENFDAIGAFRQKDGAFPIDASGVLPSGASFQGPAELRAILKGQRDEFTRCLAEKMLTFALGRGLEYYDHCTVQAITRAVAGQGYHFQTLIVEVVKSPPFQLRRALSVERAVSVENGKEGQP